MKNKIIISGTFLGTILLLTFYQQNVSSSPQTTSSSTSNVTFVSALRAEPNPINDTHDAKAIIYGSVIRTDEAPEQLLNHKQRFSIQVKESIKGVPEQSVVEVFTLSENNTAKISDDEKTNLSIGDTGVFFLDWIPQGEGFYALFGGPRGAFIENNGRVRDWDGQLVNTNDFIKSIETILNTTDDRPVVKTLGEMIEESKDKTKNP